MARIPFFIFLIWDHVSVSPELALTVFNGVYLNICFFFDARKVATKKRKSLEITVLRNIGSTDQEAQISSVVAKCWAAFVLLPPPED